MKPNMTREEIDAIERDPYFTDRERHVFTLYYRRGWYIEDIAAELDVHRRTIDNILKSIRKKAFR